MNKYLITYFDEKSGEIKSISYLGTKEECYKRFKKDFPELKKQRVAIEKVSC